MRIVPAIRQVLHHAVARTGVGPDGDHVLALARPFRPGLLQVVDVPDEEDGHDGNHEQHIKHIKKSLVRHEIPGVALYVLDDAEHAAHEHEPAGGVQHPQMAPPSHRAPLRGQRRRAQEAPVEQPRDDDEEAEDDDLHPQPREEDLLAEVEQVGVARALEPAAAGLQGEGEDVAGDEDARDPEGGDEGVVLGADGADQAREDHVDGGGEEGGGDEDEDGLHDVGAQGFLVGVAQGAAYVADGLDCEKRMVSI